MKGQIAVTGPSFGVLRPLGLGEVLDRAVNLCVKNFMPLALVVLAFAIPFAVVNYFAAKDLGEVMRDLTAGVATPGRPADPQAVLRSLGTVKSSGWYAALLVLTAIVGPLPFAALISAVSQRYLAQPTSFGAAYAVGLRRWLPLLGVNVLYALAFVLAYVVLILGIVFLAFGLALLTSAFHAVGIVLDVVVGTVAILALLALFIVAVLAFELSYFTCVVENKGPLGSFASGLSRAFARIGFKRSLLVGLVFFAIAIGITVVTSAGELLFVGLFHSQALGTVYATLVRIATSTFTTAFIAIFYFDLRVREEGLDLQLAAQNVGRELTSSP